jgi:hypothetical protein
VFILVHLGTRASVSDSVWDRLSTYVFFMAVYDLGDDVGEGVEDGRLDERHDQGGGRHCRCAAASHHPKFGAY